MSQIRAVLFDMDGVLINTEPVHYQMWKETFHNRGLEISYDVYKGSIGTTDAFLLELVRENYGCDFREDKNFWRREWLSKSEPRKRNAFLKCRV